MKYVLIWWIWSNLYTGQLATGSAVFDSLSVCMKVGAAVEAAVEQHGARLMAFRCAPQGETAEPIG
jgi:hypothetical protein